MDVAALARTSAPTPFAVSGSAASPGVRQALALIDGAVDTVRTVKREAQSVQRRAPEPFADKIDIKPPAPRETTRAAEDAPKADDIRKARPDSDALPYDDAEPGLAAFAPAGPGRGTSGRGTLVDIQA